MRSPSAEKKSSSFNSVLARFDENTITESVAKSAKYLPDIPFPAPVK